ncbi:MAG: DNA methylase [Bacteroidales bacterium]|nr:DNA methylase [Bacteroidales bacterium]
MEQENRHYIAIDLKSFYASVECVERDLDPLQTNLVVADESRTDKTICLAISPSLKAYGISGRPRLFEVRQKLREVNEERRRNAPGRRFTGKSPSDPILSSDPGLEIDMIIAPPRMAHYMEFSTRIYKIYLNYVASKDIHVYSIDEAFIDVTDYLPYYKTTAMELVTRIIRDVRRQTGITATGGVGTNLYLAKVAMDIVAKHIEADKDGVRVAELDEMSYRRLMWDHRPLTDFWRVGRGTARRLESIGICTMGQLARCSIRSEEALYKLFGINAELLIDHAWGWEPCTMSQIKAYRPDSRSISGGQVLSSPYDYAKTRIVIQEMADNMVLDLIEKRLVTDRITITIGYDAENSRAGKYSGETHKDHYGRLVPKHGHGTVPLGRATSSRKIISKAALDLFDRITDKNLLVRRITISCDNVTDERDLRPVPEQADLFADQNEVEARRRREEEELAKERRMQQTLIGIKRKYGKNSILRGLDFEEGATTIQRNQQIGGHKA